MTGRGSSPLEGTPLTEAISAAMVDLYSEFYGHTRTTATTYINDNVVVCVLEDILSDLESTQVAVGEQTRVIDGRVAFQEGAQDEFTAARAPDPAHGNGLSQRQPDNSGYRLRAVLPRSAARGKR